jgi:type II secretory pathway pseudopilin PulG
MIVILVIAVILSIAIPSFLSSRARSRQKTCLSNQRVINAAKDQFAMEYNKNVGDLCTATDLVPVYLRGVFPYCPEGGTYSINPIGQDMSCSINSGPYKHMR